MKHVFLTFDDGPHAQHTGAVLDTLRSQGVSATFFVTGRRVRAHPELVERAKAEGHCIANHSFSHPHLTTLPLDVVRREILTTHELIEPYLDGLRLFRPPYGETNEAVDAVLAELGYRSVLWDVDTEDWKPSYPPGCWVEQGLEQMDAAGPAVVLAHDIHRTTADHLCRFIDRIRALGDVTFATCRSL
jgi:peptidoglycan/xylan/chitin deacetylase (PgdA/CDA1 family)